MLDDRRGSPLGRVGAIRVGGTSIKRVALSRALASELRGIRIKPQAYLAAALRDEPRQPVSEWSDRYPPLTFFFNPEPAEKRGTWRRITLHGDAWRFNKYSERASEGPAPAPN